MIIYHLRGNQGDKEETPDLAGQLTYSLFLFFGIRNVSKANRFQIFTITINGEEMFFSILKLLILFGLIIGILLFFKKQLLKSRTPKEGAAEELEEAKEAYELTLEHMTEAEKKVHEEELGARKALEMSEALKHEVEETKKSIIK